MDFLTGLVLIGMVAALLQWVTSLRTVAVLDLLAAGFLPYRADDGWPQGVQEEDPVAWSWSGSAAADDPGLADDLPDMAMGDAEIVEITRGLPIASSVHRERLRRGSASGPR